MAIDIEKLARKRAQTSFVSTIIGISLVLSLIGMAAWIGLSAKDLARNARESIYVDVNFLETTKEADIIQFEKTLKAEPYVKRAHYVNKEESLKWVQQEFGNDSILSPDDTYNPILPHIELYIKEEYANLESVKKIEEKLLLENQGLLESVTYDSNMFRDINQNINKITLILLAVSILVLIVAVALINNTIRLAIYSKRFLIRSMQLVGARQGFIRRPYLIRAILQGIIAGIMALGILILCLYGLSNWNPDLNKLVDFDTLLIIFGGITLGGICISWISTYFALRKYLRIKTDLLY